MYLPLFNIDQCALVCGKLNLEPAVLDMELGPFDLFGRRLHGQRHTEFAGIAVDKRDEPVGIAVELLDRKSVV